MKSKTFFLSLAAMLVAVSVCYAAGDVFMGTWKLNEAKSKMTAGTPKNSTVAYVMEGDSIKCAIDGTDASGQPYHSDWSGKFDGKDYPLVGDPSNDTRSYKMVDDHTLISTSKKDGKATLTARIAVSADGKSRTVTISGTDASGKKLTSTEVYDKQ